MADEEVEAEGSGIRVVEEEEEEVMLMMMMLPTSLHEGLGVTNLVKQLLQLIETVGSFVNFRKTQRKECSNLVRRLKLLVPLLEELHDLPSSIPDHAFTPLLNLKKPLFSANKLLKLCNSGSKIYLALENEAIVCRFHAVYDKLYEALEDMPYDQLGISEEVKEQVELIRVQLNRAKRRTETQDIELAMDMMVVFSKEDDRNADSAIIERLAKKLELHTIADLKTETVAVSKLTKDRGLHKPDQLKHIMELLGKFKQIAGIEENKELDSITSSRCLEKCPSLQIPNEFLCPITLEIMTDPVIVATGQTYERESIQRWFNSGHYTCPKTGQTLRHLTLAPNFALRNLILQWSERNNYELPKKDKDESSGSPICALVEGILSLIEKLPLSMLDLHLLRDAIMKIRLLSKENPDNRILIAKNGGISPLVKLLSFPDSEVQEHAVTALLNLSLAEANKRRIAEEGAIPAIIEVLQKGTEKARENSAAALFSLSTLDENKLMVGSSNGIPPLVNLLRCGTPRGKKDAATALFNLTLNQANKSRAIEAGIIRPLLGVIEDKRVGMIDEALSILLLVASHPEGRNEMGKLCFIRTLVEIMRDGTPKNKECATAVLLELGSNNTSLVLAALQCGVLDRLKEITISGTNRARRKAYSLLRLASKCEHQQIV